VNLVVGMVVSQIQLVLIILIPGFTDIVVKMYLLRLMNIIKYAEIRNFLIQTEEIKLHGVNLVAGMVVSQIQLVHTILIHGYTDIVVKMCLLKLMNITEFIKTLKCLLQTQEDNLLKL